MNANQIAAALDNASAQFQGTAPTFDGHCIACGSEVFHLTQDECPAWQSQLGGRLFRAEDREAADKLVRDRMAYDCLRAQGKSHEQARREALGVMDLCRQCSEWTTDGWAICADCRAEGFIHTREPQDGQITRPGCRFCASCDREHGAEFICPSYSPVIVEAVRSYISPEPLPGQSGDGISSLVASMSRRSSR